MRSIHVQTVRLSDMILQQLNPSKPSDILQQAGEMEFSSNRERDISLIYSGVAVGVEEVQEMATRNLPDLVKELRGYLAVIDEQLDSCASMETRNALVAIRTPVADGVAKRIKILVDVRTHSICENTGIPEHMIPEPAEGEEDDPLGLLAIGLEAYRRSPEMVLGWYQQSEKGKLQGMNCKCPQCCIRAFAKNDESVPEASRKMLAGTSLSDALLNYATFLLEVVRAEIAGISQGVENLHEMDPEEADRVSQEAIDKMLGRK